MTADRKNPGAGFWATVLLVGLLILYPLSFGPAMGIMGWLLHAGWISEGGQVPFLVFYYPLVCAAQSSSWFGSVLLGYARLFGPSG